MSEQVCPECDAGQGDPREKCWLCGTAIPPSSSQAVATLPETSEPLATFKASKTLPAQTFSFSLATLLLLMTLASVCLALVTAYPGLGVPVCVLLVPVLIRTARVVQHRKAIGVPVSNAEKMGLLLTLFGVATVLIIVTIVAAFASFCGIFLLMTSEGEPDMLIWGLGMCVFAVTTIVLAIKWNRRRYRREMDRDWVNRNFMQNKPPSDGANERDTG